MKMSILFLLGVLFLGCASIPPEQQHARQELLEKHYLKFDEPGGFFSAIQNNNVEALRLFIKSRESLPYTINTERADQGTTGVYALELAIKKPEVLALLLQWKATGPQAKDQIWMKYEPVCPGTTDQTFEVLLKYAPQSSGMGWISDRLAGHDCIDELKRFVSLYPSSARGIEPETSSGFYYGHYFKLVSEVTTGSNSQEKYDHYKAILASFREANDRECKNKVLSACRANKELDDLAPQLDANYQGWLAEDHKRQEAGTKLEANIKKEEQYEASGKKDFDRACAVLKQIAFDKKSIADEKAIANHIGGAVASTTLYEAGRRLEGDYQFLEAMKQGFKSKTGKTFNSQECTNRSVSSDEPN